MNNLTIYRILTYIIFLIGAFMAMLLLTFLMAALANPVLLLPTFMVACVVIYSYCSWRFLTRGIDAHMYCKTSLRDLTRVNGYGALAFASLTAIQCISLIMNPALLNDILEQAMSMQKSSVEGMEEMMTKFMGFLLKFMLVYSVLLLVHIFSTFRLLKIHADAFDLPGTTNNP
ncbi:hypothetical protein KJS94_00130 [Flavihumibacter rivuli]|uniref:hypothetical protein n=1 Tax=Flavihumibacter rivuli TaxID=2838156 RepID=UPI001BDEA0CE|nr:hypothetical protein [Flavihumibacter rivuli]ULQ56609.1 hypothetical protein KJS94_00130 [Flavihumibacter rivuli]